MQINDLQHLTELSNAERKRQAGVQHDQFFTRPEIAHGFATWVKGQPFYSTINRVIDPATGAGALADNFPGAERYDLHPQDSETVQQDFLTSQHPKGTGTLVVMNPPFGRSSDMAIAFFNKAATFADYIAQIVPRTFRRHSIQARLDPHFELVDEYILPRGSFYLPGEQGMQKYDVPAVAQIWRKIEAKRDVTTPTKTSPLFTPVRDPKQADFAFRRKGRRAGEVLEQGFEDVNPNSFYFIKGDPALFKQVDWKQYGNDVMGARSISLADIVVALHDTKSVVKEDEDVQSLINFADDHIYKQNKKLADFMKKRCAPWLQAISAYGHPKELFVYRGKRGIPPTTSAFVRKIRKDRWSKDTPNEWANVFNYIIGLVGGVANRSNSAFVTSSHSNASDYGTPYVFMPIGDFHYTWSPEWDDWWSALIDQSEGYILFKPSILEEISEVYGVPVGRSAIKYLSKGDISWESHLLDAEKYKEWIYADRNLGGAIRSRHELMISARAGLYIDKDVYAEVMKTFF